MSSMIDEPHTETIIYPGMEDHAGAFEIILEIYGNPVHIFEVGILFKKILNLPFEGGVILDFSDGGGI
jgi:hypothetical protein